MADPGLSAAEFDRVWSRVVELWLKQRRFLRKVRDRFLEDQIVVYVDGDGDGYLVDAKCTLSGTDLSTAAHVDTDHIAYVTIDANAPGTTDTTVDVYRDSGKSDKQATGVIVDGSVPGDVSVNGVATTDPDYVFRLTAVPGADVTDIRLLHAESASRVARRVLDRTEEEDANLEQSYLAALASMQASIASAISTLDGWARTSLSDYISNRLKMDDALAFLTKKTTGGGTTAVAEDVDGILEQLRTAMADNTASVESVLSRVPSAGTVTYDAGNAGTYSTDAAPTLFPYCQAGRVHGRLTRAKTGLQDFEVWLKPDNRLTDSGERSIIRSLRPMRAGKAWADPNIGVDTMTIGYSITRTNETGTPLHATTNLAVSGENETNMPGGLTYVRVDGSSGNWTISCYTTSAGRAAEDTDLLVAQATGVANSASFTCTEQNDSGLSVSAALTGTPSDNDLATIDLNIGAVGDRWYFDITVASGEGKVQGELAMLPTSDTWYLREVTSGQTVAEALLTRGGPLWDSRDY